MKEEKSKPVKNFIIKSLMIITSVLPLALSSAVFMGFDYIWAVYYFAAIPIINFTKKPKKIMPVYSAFLVAMFAAKTCSPATLSLAACICGVVSLIFYFLPKQFRIRDNPVTVGVMLSTALSVTVMLTTHYFGIGASGDTVKEMIASYLSLGFHPNWRGVLYGTVVMVIMITFPRKFKKFCEVISAPFIAIAVTLVLNLFLNPSYMPTAITEIGNIPSYDSSIDNIAFFRGGEINYTVAVLCGLALFFICNYSFTQTDVSKSDCRGVSVMNAVSGTAFGYINLYKISDKLNSGSLILYLALITVPLFFGVTDRIPLHSLAVIMIVGAWESVEWKKLKEAFSSVPSVIFFVLSCVATLYFGFVYGILISAVLYLIYSIAFQKKTNSSKTNIA